MKHMVPRVFNKFAKLGSKSDLLQSLHCAKRKEAQVGVEGQNNGGRRTVLLPNFHMRMTEPENGYYTEDEDQLHYTLDQNQVPKRKKLSKQIDSAYLQKAVLATAISALRSKRQNSSCLPQHGLIGNQALNDITALLQMFQESSNTFDTRSLNNISEIVQEIQEEIGATQSLSSDKNTVRAQRNTKGRYIKRYKHGQQCIHNNVNTMEQSLVNRFNLIPSPVQKNMVPGIHGERILSSLHVLPSIPRKPRGESWLTRPIPERHGNTTVLNHRGHTNYGSMAFHWTTWTCDYDGNPNVYECYKTRTTSIKPTQLSSVNEKDNHHISKGSYHSALTLPKLKSLSDLERGNGVISANFIRNMPAPPNTALACTR